MPQFNAIPLIFLLFLCSGQGQRQRLTHANRRIGATKSVHRDSTESAISRSSDCGNKGD